MHRVIHDLWTLLREMISYVFATRRVQISTCPILESVVVMVVWNLEWQVRIIENKWNKIINKHNT